MKKKELTDLRAKDIIALRSLVNEKKTLATKKQVEIAGGKEKNLKVASNLRREIAKILTLIKEKEILETLPAGRQELQK